MFNVQLLQEQLDAAGIPTHGVDSSGGISFKDEATAQQVQQAAAIVAAHNPAVLTEAQQIEAARTAIRQGRDYLTRQLAGTATPDPITIVATIKPVIDGNTILTRIMTRQLSVMNTAYGWLVADVLTLLSPNNAINRNRYIAAVEQIIALLG